MHNLQHFRPNRAMGNRRAARRSMTALLVSVLLIIMISAGVTLAFLFTQTASVENAFVLAQAACTVEETFDGEVKQDVYIRNTGNIDAYIRAAVIVSWAADDGNSVYAAKPIAGTDYRITYTSGGEWLKGANDFWYYESPVAVDGYTTDLIESCTVIAGRAPNGFHLSVEIVASAIQSSPETVAEEQWKVTVENGKITSVPRD